MNLFLIRHAQTDYAKEGRYYSFTDIELNEKGITQTKKLKEKLNILPVLIFSSPLKRAHQTARILFPDKKIISDSSLTELNFGLWEGLTSQEISQKYPDLYNNWLINPYRYSPPSGENLLDLEKRTSVFLQNILTYCENETVVCVSHAGPLKAMIYYLLDKNFRDFWNIDVSIASINYFKLKNKKVVSYKLNETMLCEK